MIKAFKAFTVFSKFRRRYEHGCQMLFIYCKTIIFTAKRSIKSTLKNAKFDLFGSEKASSQIWLRTEIG